MSQAGHGAILALRAVYETLAISVPTVADGAFTRETMVRSDERLARWSRRLLEQAEVRLTVEGQQHVEPGRPYVVMSNHASHYDVPVLYQAWPGTMRMVAKTELYRVPLFGRAMTSAGFIEIDRSNRERAIASLKVARQRLAMGISVWIAPEGTRSRTGELKPFKKGGFMLAMETGLAVTPVGIVGSRDILPVGHRWVRVGARVHVTIGRPIAAPVLTAEGNGARDRLMAEVRTAIDAAMARGRDVLSMG